MMGRESSSEGPDGVRGWEYPIKTAVTFLVLSLALWGPAVYVMIFVSGSPDMNGRWGVAVVYNVLFYPFYVLVGAAIGYALRYKPGASRLFVWAPVFLFLGASVAFGVAQARHVATDGLTSQERSFLQACSSGDVEAVLHGLRGGSDPNLRSRRGDRPILLAIAGRHADVLQVLLEHGADPEIVTGQGDVTSLVAHDDMLELLLMHGLDPDFGGTGNLIGAAVQRGYVKTVALLIAYGADPSIAGRPGEDALSRAIRLERWDAALLIARTCPSSLIAQARALLEAGHPSDHPGRKAFAETITACELRTEPYDGDKGG